MKASENKNFIQNIFRKAKIIFLKIYYTRGSSHEIALGAAIGAFWGVFPTFGLSTILSLMLYKLFRFNLLSAISGAFISNPLTSPFFLLLSYNVGTLFIKTNIKFEYKNIKSLIDNASQIGYVLIIGSAIISTVTGLLVYFITKYAIEYRRRPKIEKPNKKTSLI